MFTGIVTEIGEVKSIQKRSSSFRLGIKCEKVGKDMGIGGSIAVNGVCLSITEKKDVLYFDVVGNTENKTNLGNLTRGEKVNLESALKQGDDISGHMVSGHVDSMRKIKKSQKSADGWILDIEMLPVDTKYLIPRGSVAVDGVSLTVSEVSRGYFRIFLIPHTLKNTTLQFKKAGNFVNIEFDMLAKYVEKNTSGTVSKDMLRKSGFM